MLKVDQKVIEELEKDYEGITTQIIRFERAELPSCPNCKSSDTADVEVGIVGRTIAIATATTKIKLIPNNPVPGDYFCNACQKFFS